MPRQYKCSRCGLLGHNARTCGNAPPSTHQPPVRRQNQCQHCKGYGHNKRTCTNTFNEFYVPPPPRTQEKRQERWLPQLKKRHPGLVEKLGTASDATIALQYGLSRQRVHQFRCRLGIPKFKAPPLLLTDQQEALLGSRSDAALAKEWGVPISTVSASRTAKGVPTYTAQRLKYHESLIQPYRHLLGVESDPKVAALIGEGVTEREVYRYRVRHGISGKPVGRWNPLDRSEITRLFHEGLTDDEIARRLKAHPGSIYQIRSSLGLFRRVGKEPR